MRWDERIMKMGWDERRIMKMRWEKNNGYERRMTGVRWDKIIVREMRELSRRRVKSTRKQRKSDDSKDRDKRYRGGWEQRRLDMRRKINHLKWNYERWEE